MLADRYDVVFLGGGLTSSMSARFLKLRHPELSLLILEKNTKTHWNPGESTVGVAGLFMIRDLGLSTYAYVHHLPKNALRFFFQRSGEPFDPTRCSEIGTNMLPVFPTFQVDRARLDADLWAFNRAIGIEVATGADVQDVRIAEGAEPHEIRFIREGRERVVESRWVVHGAGRNAKFGAYFDRLSPVRPIPDYNTAAAWGRFAKVGDIDLLGDETWRRRAGFTSRYLSTNHFMGRGFWIWAIPIGQDVVSWGVVYDKDLVALDLTERQTFVAFLQTQGFPRALLAGAELLDFQCHPQLPFKRERFCSEQRWAAVGDAHAFMDPFYSPGSDNIARHAYMLEHLVLEEAPARLAEKVRLINAYIDVIFEQQRLLYVGQYGGFGSYEAFNIKSLWDFFAYSNLLVRAFYEGRHADLEWIAEQVRLGDSTTALMAAIQRGFRELTQHLWEQERYERRNLDEYSMRQNRFRVEEQILQGSADDVARLHLYLCRIAVSETLESRFEMRGFLRNRLAQELLSPQEISGFELSEAWLATFLGKVSRKLEAELHEAVRERVSVELSPQCFGSPLPRSLEALHPMLAGRAARIWQERAVNPLQDSLYA